MASHNSDFIDAFYETNKDSTKVYHFKTHEDEEGKIVFDYEIKEGPAPSNAIKIAEQMGLGMITAMIDTSEPALIKGKIGGGIPKSDI